MHQLLYKSNLLETVSWEGVIEIAEQARANNAKREITGMLVMHQGEVLQVLEGKRRQLSELFLKIAKDPRHDQIELLKYQAITHRQFGNWKMKEVALHRLPEPYAAAVDLLLLPIHGRLPDKAIQAEALLTLVAAITSNS